MLKIRTIVEKILFFSKWILVPFYLKLCWVLIVLLFYFLKDGHITNNNIMSTLEAVDVVMIGNLIVMIITGSYNSFVTKSHEETSEKISSGGLKIKMSTSIIGVASIHILQTFITSEIIVWDLIFKQVFIYCAFIIGALSLAIINYFYTKSDSH